MSVKEPHFVFFEKVIILLFHLTFSFPKINYAIPPMLSYALLPVLVASSSPGLLLSSANVKLLSSEGAYSEWRNVVL